MPRNRSVIFEQSSAFGSLSNPSAPIIWRILDHSTGQILFEGSGGTEKEAKENLRANMLAGGINPKEIEGLTEGKNILTWQDAPQP